MNNNIILLVLASLGAISFIFLMRELFKIYKTLRKKEQALRKEEQAYE